jgi:hypothetical protein
MPLRHNDSVRYGRTAAVSGHRYQSTTTENETHGDCAPQKKAATAKRVALDLEESGAKNDDNHLEDAAVSQESRRKVEQQKQRAIDLWNLTCGRNSKIPCDSPGKCA